MGVTQYIGSRYVPLFADPAEWSSAKTYEPLTIVLHEGNSYTSKQFVPKGIQITNEAYWALTGNFNGQVEAYRREALQAYELAQDAQDTADNAMTSIQDIMALTDLIYQANGAAKFLVNGYVDELSCYVVGIKLPKICYEFTEIVRNTDFNETYIKSQNGFGMGLSVVANYVSNGVAYPLAARTTGWGYAAVKNTNVTWVEDYSLSLNATNLANMGYEFAFVTFQPIILNNIPYNYDNIPPSAPEREYVLDGYHARQVFGWDSDNYYMFIFDGRTPFSNGIDSNTMKSYLVNLGIPNAVNCDGGGSTQLWNMPDGYNMAHIRNPSSPEYSKPNKARAKAIEVFKYIG